MTTRAELSSIATALAELANRISIIADGLGGPEKDEVGPQLFEVERGLRAAERRLDRILRP